MNTENITVTGLFIFLFSVIAGITAGSMYDTYKAAEMVKNGADPIKVACLFHQDKCAFVK